MVVVSNQVLKTFFQGDKPAASHFAALIDSMVNKLDDAQLLGLRSYDSTRVYSKGETVIHKTAIYECTGLKTTGKFEAKDWSKIELGSESTTKSKGVTVSRGPRSFVSNSEEVSQNDSTKFETKLSLSFSPAEDGLHVCQWNIELGATEKGVNMEAKIMLDNKVIGEVMKIAQHGLSSKFESVSGMAYWELEAKKKYELTISFRKRIGSKQAKDHACLSRRARLVVTKA